MDSLDYQDHPLFPAKAPTGQAHIFNVRPDDLKVSAIHVSLRYQLCDIIPTFLTKLEMYPSALTDFFKPEVESFKFVREGEFSFMIWRRGRQVFVSLTFRLLIARSAADRNYSVRLHQTSYDPPGIAWKNLTRTRLSDVAYNAIWTPSWGAWSAHTREPWDTFWESGFQQVNQPLYRGSNPYDYIEMRRNAYEFGKAIWLKETWKVQKDVRFSVDANLEDAEPVPILRLDL
jgi:hypothetical protein